jgi:hypothetical protein
MLKTPVGLAEVIRTFGDIHKYIKEDGTLDPSWEREKIVRIPLPAPLDFGGSTTKVTRITSHTLLANILSETLSEVHKAGLWRELSPYGGGFVFRPQRAGTAISMHAWGIAWDFDPPNNKMGTKGDMAAEVVRIFESKGFFWGGNFKRRTDPMHFQFAKGV